MRNLETIQITFDPAKSDKQIVREIFKNHTATVLWCSIKTGNIVDQYFNDTVMKVAKEIDEKEPWNYHEFLKIVSPLTNQFGKVVVSFDTFCGGYEFEIDHEFWFDIFAAIKHKRCFRLEQKNEGSNMILKIIGTDVEYKLDFKFFNEMKYIPRIGETIVVDHVDLPMSFQPIENSKFKVVDIETHMSTELKSASINQIYIYLEKV
jgi:hypothetical protein